MYQRQVSYREAVESALKQNYCNFDGRASRSQYWWWVLFTFIVGLVAGVVGRVIGGAVGELIPSLVGLALFLPGLGLSVRRLHDIGKSGWLLLLSFIPLVGAIILIIWFVKNSDMAPNQYGPVPNMVD